MKVLAKGFADVSSWSEEVTCNYCKAKLQITASDLTRRRIWKNGSLWCDDLSLVCCECDTKKYIDHCNIHIPLVVFDSLSIEEHGDPPA